MSFARLIIVRWWSRICFEEGLTRALGVNFRYSWLFDIVRYVSLVGWFTLRDTDSVVIVSYSLKGSVRPHLCGIFSSSRWALTDEKTIFTVLNVADHWKDHRTGPYCDHLCAHRCSI